MELSKQSTISTIQRIPTDPSMRQAMHPIRTDRRRFALGGLALAAVGVPAVAAAQGAGRTVRVIVPYPPGGFTDATARLIAHRLQEHLGQTVIVDNRPGANGIIGAQAIARATPDGSTFGVVIAAHAANTTLYQKLPYDPQKDFVAVSLIGESPLVAAVNNKSPFKSMAEIVAHARQHPDKLSFGSSGNGSAVHLTMELLQSVTQTKMIHVPFRGSALALTDLLGGQIDLFLDAAQGLIGQGKAGAVRLVGVTSAQRLPALPDVPTFAEQGIANFNSSTWAGILAPAGTPPQNVQQVADAVAKIVREPAVKAKLDEMGTVPVGSSPAEFSRFLAAETAKWGQVIQRANVKLE